MPARAGSGQNRLACCRESARSRRRRAKQMGLHRKTGSAVQRDIHDSRATTATG